LHVHVVDAESGLPLAGVSVRLTGSVDGRAFDREFVSGSDGGFSVSVYVGAYSATGMFGAYQSSERSFTVTGATTSVQLSMIPFPTPATTSVLSFPGGAFGLLLGFSATAAATLVVIVERRRDGSPTP
ncbi:MAG: carboxypeptidase-like regulatory domain-containing protein, partial [Thermoplasmata archaeon]|nr:carboxypeptidase-like regulatory domain-containing protein [Thermoplasmata archaeon]